MKITPVLPVVMLLTFLATSLAHAQTTEKLALYADKFGTDCSVSDTGVQSIIVYVIHEGTGTRSGVEFSAVKPQCWTGATFAGEFWNYPTVGGTYGASQGPTLQLFYFACRTLPLYLGKMVFDAIGASQACCNYPVLPSSWEGLVSFDCYSRYVPILGGSVVINENANCPCAPPLAVESTSWGQIKALYQ